MARTPSSVGRTSTVRRAQALQRARRWSRLGRMQHRVFSLWLIGLVLTALAACAEEPSPLPVETSTATQALTDCYDN
jgi:hypothetical protein